MGSWAVLWADADLLVLYMVPFLLLLRCMANRACCGMHACWARGSSSSSSSRPSSTKQHQAAAAGQAPAPAGAIIRHCLLLAATRDWLFHAHQPFLGREAGRKLERWHIRSLASPQALAVTCIPPCIVTSECVGMHLDLCTKRVCLRQGPLESWAGRWC